MYYVILVMFAYIQYYSTNSYILKTEAWGIQYRLSRCDVRIMNEVKEDIG